MGFDVSTHPVDFDLIQNRLIPYIRGEKDDIADLVADALRITQVGYRANAWGLGLVDLEHQEFDAKPRKPNKKVQSTGATKKPENKRAWLVPETFDSDLHVWGRPFFITTATERVSESIDRYLAATPKQVDKIAKEMLCELNPKLVEKVTPSTKGKLPKPKQLAQNIRFPLDFYRDAYSKLKSGEVVQLPDGRAISAQELFLGSFGLDVMNFAAKLQPGWMSRGYVWFTAFLRRAKLDASKYVKSAASLFQPMGKEVKGFSKRFVPEIIENFMLGGYVQPKKVVAFRKWMEQHTEKMIEACVAEDWKEEGSRKDFLKVMESLRDAEYRKMGFLEATEVYSGPMGVMN